MWVKCSWDAQEIDGGLANDRGKDPISTIIVTRWAEQAVEFGFSHRILKKKFGNSGGMCWQTSASRSCCPLKENGGDVIHMGFSKRGDLREEENFLQITKVFCDVRDLWAKAGNVLKSCGIVRGIENSCGFCARCRFARGICRTATGLAK